MPPRPPGPQKNDVAKLKQQFRNIVKACQGDILIQEKGKWEASCLCPAHNDTSPSLSITLKKDSESGWPVLLWKCFAGCSQGAVRAGLQELGVFHVGKGSQVKVLDRVKVNKPGRGKGGNGGLRRKWPYEFVEKYVYRNSEGTATHVKNRFVGKAGTPEEGDKTFTIKHKNPENGRWEKGKGKVEMGLFGLEWLVVARKKKAPVVVCEGEKDALEVRKRFKICAVSSPNGADSWKDEWGAEFTGCSDVFVVYDNDKPGRKGCMRVCRSLCESGFSGRIWFVDGIGGKSKAGSGYDISDWINENGRDSGEVSKKRFVQEVLRGEWAKEFKCAQEGLEEGGNSGSGDDGDSSTDLYHAKKLMGLYGAYLRHDTDSKTWYSYNADTGVWEASRDLPIAQRWVWAYRNHEVEQARKMPVDGGESSIRAKNDAIKQAKALGNDKKARSVLSVYRSLPGVEVSSTEFNQARHFICVQNGVVDLRTGKLLAHSPDYKFTKQIDIEYLREVNEPQKWLGFLSQSFDNVEDRQEILRYLQKLVGVIMMGHGDFQTFAVFMGPGGTGKSTFLRVLERLLGPYSVTVGSRAFCAKGDGSPADNSADYKVAGLQGARLCLASELPENARLSEDLVKRITSGGIIDARPIYGSPVSFDAQFLLTFETNSYLRVSARDSGILRRMALIEFTHIVPAEEQIRGYADILFSQEAQGILAWAVEGACIVHAEGFGPHDMPESFRAAMDENCREWDYVRRFVDEMCITSRQSAVSSSDLYGAYTRWLDATGELGGRMSRRKFVRDVQRVCPFVTTKLIRQGAEVSRGLVGIELIPDWLTKLTTGFVG